MSEELWTVEIEPEVRQWLDTLPPRHYKTAEFATERLQVMPTTLGGQWSRHLGGKLRELRFDLDGNAIRLTYWLAPGRRIVLLTVFRKTKMRESAEVERAERALKLCEAEHDEAHEAYSRSIEEEL
ncbi:type II toxin-antitoxin system RelE/ParE family toxin [Streptomyces sp. N35]|uniref:type II toxin-antitoxin system RelE/ParE family toxin n=1 Tax=Streptomyces sp. N35 TaxID=2795730 RepID=UPI0027DABC08|nr:type II toxin-antitoxin system RelE/ParE family toxin [Streptomyces sp. N35]